MEMNDLLHMASEPLSMQNKVQSILIERLLISLVQATATLTAGRHQ